MLETQLKDNVRARVMQNDGTYVRLKPPSEDKAVDVQEFFMNNHRSKNSEDSFHVSKLHFRYFFIGGIVK